MSYDKAIALLNKSVSRPTLYRLEMPGRFIGRDTNDYIEYYCNTTQIPSVRYEAFAVQGQSEQGVTRLQPTNVVWTNPLEMSVIENSDFTVFKDFKEWLNQTAGGIDQQGQRSIKLKYYENIVGDIMLTKLEQPDSIELNNQNISERSETGKLKEVLKVTFLNSYIKSIGPLNFNTETKNTFLSYPITFNYESYKTEE